MNTISTQSENDMTGQRQGRNQNKTCGKGNKQRTRRNINGAHTAGKMSCDRIWKAARSASAWNRAENPAYLELCNEASNWNAQTLEPRTLSRG